MLRTVNKFGFPAIFSDLLPVLNECAEWLNCGPRCFDSNHKLPDIPLQLFLLFIVPFCNWRNVARTVNNSVCWPFEQFKRVILHDLSSCGFCKPMNVIQLVSQGGLTSGKSAKFLYRLTCGVPSCSAGFSLYPCVPLGWPAVYPHVPAGLSSLQCGLLDTFPSCQINFNLCSVWLFEYRMKNPWKRIKDC